MTRTCPLQCIGGWVDAPAGAAGYTAVHPCPRCKPTEHQRWTTGEYDPHFTGDNAGPGEIDTELNKHWANHIKNRINGD